MGYFGGRSNSTECRIVNPDLICFSSFKCLRYRNESPMPNSNLISKSVLIPIPNLLCFKLTAFKSRILNLLIDRIQNPESRLSFQLNRVQVGSSFFLIYTEYRKNNKPILGFRIFEIPLNVATCKSRI